MAGSRAASAREPGQIREEAALSDTARAPRTSLAGAEDRRARPGLSFRDGCTVHSLSPMDDSELVRALVEAWNSGDTDSTLELFTDDAVQRAGPEWPEQGEWRGKEEMRANIEEWRAVWQEIDVEVQSYETFGDKVVALGAWRPRGRVSGVEGTWPFSLVLTVRDGKIAVLEWFTDKASAVAAARDA
jgi:ketosteroid isomerase-like protein